ncbi:YheC/YheD family protein [Cohnella zeiphila]|uniref:YheC/YheD family protein n=1 Tax=Cohnella zeiphila TaxID=2761120 RepID=A0A7X0SM11_9BACL|nr:YheC/YheD family protein [Cohnella zeiphila]MBB6732493.1 YheC/YheD family protein [Cohnella zeiphila]
MSEVTISSGRQLASKWLKTNALLANPYLANHIPPSRLLNAANLRTMLGRYGMVVIKPVRGGGGIGVMKITRAGGAYKCTYMARTHTFRSFGGLMSHVNRSRRGKAYLIQKGIRLASVGGRPIDYRVKYVKENGSWTFRSMVGRLARRGLFVTNLCRGGLQMTAAQGIGRSLSPRLISSKKSEMRRLTRMATSLMERRFPGIGQLGYDYGIDRNGHIWILEVNTRPQ